MKVASLLIAGTLAASTALTLQAREHDYQKGVLLRMDSSSCGYSEKDGKTLVGQIVGTDGQHKKAQELLCQEYVLESDRLTYRIRPKDAKHPALLPVGESAQFRLHKDKMILRVAEGDGKEREYLVISMVPRDDAKTTQAARVNP
jgi:hypothetical protein